MPGFQLILTSDTINQGRIKINDAFSATTGIWSGSTGNQSIIANNGTGNISSGEYAVSYGSGNTANGDSSTALGINTTADTIGSFSQGTFTYVGGNYSFAGGEGLNDTYPILAQANNSFAFYRQSTTPSPTTEYGIVKSDSVILGGLNHYINSTTSCILGGTNNKIAGGGTAEANSILGGLNNKIAGGTIGTSSILGGAGNILSGVSVSNSILSSTNCKIYNNFNCSTISSNNTTISDPGSFIFNGLNTAISSQDCNIPDTFTNSLISGKGTQTLGFGGNNVYYTFGWGSGGPSTSNNTLSIEIETGNVRSTGTFTPTTAADYAEFFEWSDGNIGNEDRVGFFVSISNDTIEKGNSNILGIVSANPAIVTDSASFNWHNMWLKDDFGRIKTFEYDIYKKRLKESSNEILNREEVYLINYQNLLKLYNNGVLNEAPNKEESRLFSEYPNQNNFIGKSYVGEIREFEKTRTSKANIPNINYDSNKEYVPREERLEWDAIGLLGKLHVRTAESITGATVSANVDGMAINGTDYHVLKQVKEYDGSYGVVQILFK